MEPYVGIAVFELFRSGSSGSGKKSFFREDFYIVYADSDQDAERRVEKLAREQETTEDDGLNAGPGVVLRHIVDVAPALYGHVNRDCDLYSRHFDSLETYQKFEMKLGGKDPLQDE